MHVADNDDARLAGPLGDDRPADGTSDDARPRLAHGADPELETTAGSHRWTHPAVIVPERTHRLFWWKEAAIVIVFYIGYSWIRNQFGSNQIAAEGIPTAAFRNAERVISFQQWIGLYFESSVQQWYLENLPGIRAWNIFYGSAHFVVTLAVFAVLFWKRPAVFPQWRNSLAVMTALAIVGFAMFALMPPRLLDQPCPWEGDNEFGGRCIASDLRGADGFGYVDTLAVHGGLWSFDSTAFASISNQYAAMPSLHIGWSTWCAIAMWPLLRRWRWRLAMLAYPSITLFCIIVTGNHWWLDGAGGLLAFGIGSLIGWSMHRWNQDRLEGQHLRLHGAHPVSTA